MPSRAYSVLSARVRQFRDQVLAPERRRHPLVRIVCRLLAIALLGAVLLIGMLLCSALVVLAAIQRLLRGEAPVPTAPDGRVVEGQYRVVKPDTDHHPPA